MERNYFHIGVYLKTGNPMVGVRTYETDDYNKVYELVTDQINKQHTGNVLKIDVWRLMRGRSQELEDYLLKDANKKFNTNQL